MSYKDKESERLATRERVRRYREAHKGVTTPKDVTPCGVTPSNDQEGVDGWHFDQTGRAYILQDTGFGGLVRCYHPAPKMFNYHQEPHPDYVKNRAVHIEALVSK